MVDMPLGDHVAPMASGADLTGLGACCGELMRLSELDSNQQPCD
jgi:hypothetical protein